MFKKPLQLFLKSLIFSLIISQKITASPALNLNHYQGQEGEITLGYEGDFVDPYFAMRALVTAKEEGLNTDKQAILWIRWLIQRQDQDGLFYRYCKMGTEYEVCQAADADDINMALWAQLLTQFANKSSMPFEWQQSYNKSINYLEEKLYDPQSELYFVSTAIPVSLFMDNVEIAHAFFKIAESKRLQGDFAEAQLMESKAQKLSQAIQKNFAKNNYYEVSTQPYQTHGFYPGAVAQIYPWVFSIPCKWPANKENFLKWYTNWHISEDWFKSDYAWGLVALAAKKTNHFEITDLWLNYVKKSRPHARWNVLEEMVYQLLKKNLPNRR